MTSSQWAGVDGLAQSVDAREVPLKISCRARRGKEAVAERRTRTGPAEPRKYPPGGGDVRCRRPVESLRPVPLPDAGVPMLGAPSLIAAQQAGRVGLVAHIVIEEVVA